MKTTLTAIAMIAAMTGSAQAACNVTDGPLGSHVESDCASASGLSNLGTTVSNQGTALGDLQAQVSGIQVDAFHATDDIGGESNHSQAIAIGNQSTAAGFGSRVGLLVPAVPDSCTTAGNVVNAGQCYDAADVSFATPIAGDFVAGTPERIDPINNGTALGAGAIVEHNGSTAVGAGAKTTRDNQVVVGTETTDVTVKSLPGKVDKTTKTVVVHQADGTLASDGGQIYGTLTTHNDQIVALQGLANTHGARLDAHSALLSQHSATLDTHAKGLAIAMAMPDLYLNEKERFTIAGNLGGFDGETAIGIGAAMRLDQVWSLNLKGGADTEAKEFGWAIGARAGF